jgi:hypothetical protein
VLFRRDCGDVLGFSAHPGNGAFVYQRQSILLAADGVTPNTVVSFHFMHNNSQVA